MRFRVQRTFLQAALLSFAVEPAFLQVVIEGVRSVLARPLAAVSFVS